MPLPPVACRVVQRVDTVADDALGTDDMTGLLRRLARGEVSAAELREASLARAYAADDRLNAVTTWVEAPPERGDRTGSLAGVPTVVKDNEDLAGFVTTECSWATPTRRARVSAPWVAQYLRLGVSPIAKTTLPEFGLTASTESSRFGVTRNPWDLSRSAGGSSGGSAALVAAGVVPIAHANDGGGSIRIPAACCGLVGLKPSRRRLLDRPELQRLPVPLTTQGVLTRTVRDTARYLAEAERAYRDPRLPAVGLVQGPDPRRLRIGVVAASTLGLPVAAATRDAVRATGLLLAELGHHVEEATPPVDARFGPDFLRYWAFLAFVLTSAGRQIYGDGFDGRRVEEFTRGLGRYFARRAQTVPGSLSRLRRIARTHRWSLAVGYDVVVSPVVGDEPLPIGHLGPDVDFRTHLVRLLRYSSFTPVQNVSGAPAISLPLARTAAGLPLGVQLAAPYGQEARLLSLAYELEAAAPWPTRTTGVDHDQDQRRRTR